MVGIKGKSGIYKRTKKMKTGKYDHYKARGRKRPDTSKLMKGNKYALGYKHTDEWKKEASKRHLGMKIPKETGEKISKALKGRKCPWVSEYNRNRKAPKGENHYNWRGGISFELYSVDFNKQLKEQIRARDNHTCQECRYTEKQLGHKLHVHHIDFNKQNNNPNNLISLCRSCHMQTNFNREDWTNYFHDKIEEVN